MEQVRLQIEYLPIGKLKAYKNNARKHQDEDVGAIESSIEEFNFNDPIGIWGEKNIIVEGHGRLLAGKKAGMKEVPVIRLDHLTDEQRRAYALAHNRTAELSVWDDGLLASELDNILDIDMSAFGFDMEEKEQVVEDDYDPEPPEIPNAKYGDIYQLGVHRLMCGDSTNVKDVEKLVDGAEIDMLLTDPPYNVNYDEKEKSLMGFRVNARIEGTNLTNIKNDAMDSSDFRLFLAKAFFNAKEVMRLGAVFHVWHSEWEAYNFRGALADVGLKCRQELIWVKNNMSIGRADFQRQYEGVLTGDNIFDEEMERNGFEQCLYGWKDGAGHTWKKKRKEKDVLYFDKPRASDKHPTMKPILLFDYEMRCNTQKGDRILDLFTGSGTTLMAAEQNGRIAYCMEMDPKFVDVIIDRWESFTGEKAVLLNDA